MTIKNLKQFLKDKCGHVFKKTNIQTFKGYKIAIDVSGLAYKYWDPQQRNVIKRMNDPFGEIPISEIEHLWLQSIWTLINKFLKAGITPVMVFDGPPPKEKSNVINDRTSKKALAKSKVDEYKAKLLETPALFRSILDIQKLKDLMCGMSLLSTDNYQTLRLFFNGLGLPVLQAKNEAEELCCALCRDSLVAAVYCDDGDCLAHLTPCWIFGKSEGSIIEFEYILLDDVLKALKFTKEMFIDLCIMSGCDYNSNIKGLAIGNSYKKIKELGSIENYASSKDAEDISILNHEICRNLFAKRDSKESCNGDLLLNIDKNCVKEYSSDYLFKCQMSHVLVTLTELYSELPENKEKFEFLVLNNKYRNLIIDFTRLNI